MKLHVLVNKSSKQIHVTHEKANKLTYILLSIEYNVREKHAVCAARTVLAQYDVHQEQWEGETGMSCSTGCSIGATVKTTIADYNTYHCANVYCIKHLIVHLLSAGDICGFDGIKNVSIG